MKQPPPDALPAVFEAAIFPYRSLTRTGVIVLLGFVSSLLGLMVLRFLLLGAWPVAVFSLIEVPLLFLLLWLNMRARRAGEMIIVTEREISITTIDWRGGRSVTHMPVAWLRVDQVMDGETVRIVLRSNNGATREIGRFLHAADRESLCRSLRDAVHGLRYPTFDNPQLRDHATD
jgi:uncharacterized membrane protein